MNNTSIKVGKGFSTVSQALCPHCGVVPADQVYAVDFTNLDGHKAIIYKHHRFGCHAQVAFTLA